MNIQWKAAAELFNSRYKERGVEVFNEGRVLSIDWLMRTDTAAKIHSTVQGSQDEVYEQTLSIKARNQIPEIEGDCTCPIGYNC